MVYLKRAQVRVIEAILAASIIIVALLIANPFFLNTNLIKEKKDKEDIASKVLSFLIEKGIIKQAYYGNYQVIVDVLEKMIPSDYGFKISFYDEEWNLLWSYQRVNFDERNAVSAQAVLNGADRFSRILIVVLSI